MLHKWPRWFRASASSTIRLVTPWATPVSITTSGRVCSATHHTARHSELSPSAYQAYVSRPKAHPLAFNTAPMSSITSSSRRSSGHGQGAPSSLCRCSSQASSTANRGYFLRRCPRYHCRYSPGRARLTTTGLEANVRAKRMIFCRRVPLQATSADRLNGVCEHRQSLVDFGVGGGQGRQQLDHLVAGACGFHQ